MKKIFFSSILLIISAVSSFSQLTETEYLKKAKRQSTTGGIILGTGCASVLIGFILNPQLGVSIGGNNNTSADKVKASGTFYTIGACMGLASIPFFILSGSNKRKARGTTAIGFKMQDIKKIRTGEGISSFQLPAISLKISL